jgi:hypothetical protein
VKLEYILISFIASILVLAGFAAAATANIYEKDFAPNTNVHPTSPTFFVSVLKSDPYPVSAGNWFDLWIKVQNIGQNDAPDAVFTLQPEYPYTSSDNLTRDYGTVFGTANAYKVNQGTDAAEVVLKYRVYVADNAPDGVSNLKLQIKTDGDNTDSFTTVSELPIEVYTVKSASSNVSYSTESSSVKWYYGLIGLITGIFLVTIFVLIRQKMRAPRHAHA